MIRAAAKQVPPTTLENLLLEKQLINSEQIAYINQFIAENGVNIGTAVMFLDIVSGARLGELLLQTRKIPTGSPQRVTFQSNLKALIPADKAKQAQVIPLQTVDESGVRVLILGMTDPLDTHAIQKVEGLTRMRVQAVFVSLEDLQWSYRKYYKSGLTLFPLENTFSGEKTVNQRIEKVAKGALQIVNSSAAELQALISLMIAKGVFTREEFTREVKKHAP